MKGVLVFLFLCVMSSQAWGQSYQAKNAMRTHVIPVPRAAVRKFKKYYPKAQIDSCYVYENDANPNSEFMFYAKQENKLLEASFDKHGKPVESKIEVFLKDTPTPLQQIIANNDVHAEGSGRIFKEVTWLPKRKRYKKRKKQLRRAKIEYMVEFFGIYNGKKITVPMYFNESGYQANPGFR